MKESRFIKIIIIISVFMALIGGIIFSFQRITLEKFSLRNLTGSKQISLLTIAPEIIGFNGEKNYLLLFQNNLELRPAGGYIGNFGIVKVKNGNPISFEIHDTNIFDGFGKIQTDPPQPLRDYLGINNWQMRDGNWSPDFETSAKQVEYFYHLQGGDEEFDGIIAINASILPDVLELTGSIYLEDFDKEFKSEDALYQLEYEVEKGYWKRNIAEGERKTIFKALVKEVVNKIIENNLSFKNSVKNLLIKELDEKNIILFIKNKEVQEVVSKLDWSGRINQEYPNDYLMINEANLAAKKSNAFITREVEYCLDLDQEKPTATLKIKYLHQNPEKNWFNDDYKFYLRIYAPLGSWLNNSEKLSSEVVFSEEFNKTVFGAWVEVPAGEEKTIELEYLLPQEIKEKANYEILVQKQSGMNDLLFNLIVKKSEQEYIKKEIINQDWKTNIYFEK